MVEQPREETKIFPQLETTLKQWQNQESTVEGDRVFFWRFLDDIWEKHPGCELSMHRVSSQFLPQEIKEYLYYTPGGEIAIIIEPPFKAHLRGDYFHKPEPNDSGVGVAFEFSPSGWGIEFMMKSAEEVQSVNCYPYGRKGSTRNFTEFLLNYQGNERLFINLACQLAILWVKVEEGEIK